MERVRGMGGRAMDRNVMGRFDQGTPAQPDRVEVVRYDRASKFYVEFIDRKGRGGRPQRVQKSIRGAAETLARALWVDGHPGTWFKGRQFVNRFDAQMRQIAKQMGRSV